MHAKKNNHAWALFFFFFFCLVAQCVVVVVGAAAAWPEARPLHAMPPSSSSANGTAASFWTACMPGYFRTTPGDDATCRACTPEPACAVGWQLVPCTTHADAACVACPPLPVGYRHAVGGDCDTRACASGWVAATPTLCVPCPLGFYCPLGAGARDCGANCTTARLGAASPLECVVVVAAAATNTNKEEEANDDDAVNARMMRLMVAFSVLWGFTTTASPSRVQQCDAVRLLLLSPTLGESGEEAKRSRGGTWLQHGTFQGCAMQLPPPLLASSSSSSTPTMMTLTSGTLACAVLAPACVVGEFQAWFLGALAAQADALAAALGQCVGDPRAAVARQPLVEAGPLMRTMDAGGGSASLRLLLAGGGLDASASSSSLPQLLRLSATGANGSTSAPLEVEPRRWGQSHGETRLTLEFVAAGLEALALALIALVALAVVQRHRRGIILIHATRPTTPSRPQPHRIRDEDEDDEEAGAMSAKRTHRQHRHRLLSVRSWG